MRLAFRYITILILLVTGFSVKTFAQGQDKSVIFSGRVVADRSSEFLPSAYVFNPNSGRGTLTDNLGNFALYVYPGDTIQFSYVGYKKRYYVIPRDIEQTHQAYVRMAEETKMLAEVRVYPYSTEEDFKKAFLEMQLDNQAGRKALAKNLEQSKLNVLALKAGLSGAGNFRNFSDQMTYSMANRNFISSPLMTLTNPFAWAQFIQSIKRGDLKKDDYKKAYEDAPSEGVSRQKIMKEIKSGGGGQ